MGVASMSILVVEDELIVAHEICDQLARLGYTVFRPVMKGEEAVEMAAKNRPDLVIMDIGLPGDMDGISSARAIRSLMDIPVIFLTGYSDPATKTAAGELRRATLLTKPFFSNQLEAAVKRAIGAGGAGED